MAFEEAAMDLLEEHDELACDSGNLERIMDWSADLCGDTTRCNQNIE
jgi:hypothetical protein